MYFCNFCSFATSLLKTHIQHHTFHRNVTAHFYCGYDRCKKCFHNLANLDIHLHRAHGLKSIKQETFYAECSTDDNAKFVCKINICKKEVDTFSLLIKHLKQHISHKQEIECPYQTCNKTYTVLSSFTGHLSKCHRRYPVMSIDENNVDPEIVEPVNDMLMNVDTHECADEFESEDVQYTEDTESDLFIKCVAQFYLKLECELLIPISSIQYIVEELNTIHIQGHEIVKQNLKTRLMTEGIKSDQIDGIIENVFSNDPWITSHEVTKTNYKRKEFYAKEFDYVKPTYIDISKDKKTSFAYVPLMETLKSIFRDKSVDNFIKFKAPKAHKDLLRDFTDGEVFKNNTFFKENYDALQIILYQDSFEVVNPIGASKNKHKILAVYMNVGNLPDYIRSHVNTIKLVALVKEKEFDHKAVYGKIVNDFKILESQGIDVNGKIIKGSIVFITGDNLGSHSLGGFVENFSKATYFCRFCSVKRSEFYSDGGECDFYEPRTIDSYKRALEQIGKQNDFEGIKYDSVFNELLNYHVCSPGLPPCLGHDLFEGIVAYDLFLYIEYFIHNDWFTLNYLNERIDNFKYSIKDRQNKPCTITVNNTRIPGGACQIWNFLKLFPIFISDKILELDDDVYMCTLLLSEIVEIICAPAIHTSYLSYLQNIIFQYVSMRKKLFPQNNLRPKHHFLTHYPYLILQFGPLMKVWTLRYESKHRFFKRTVRHVLNFINILKTLSVKHELLQSLVRLGADIRIELAVYDVSDLQLHLYNTEIQKCIQNCNLPRSIKQCNKVVNKGTTYNPGDIIALDQEGYRYNLIIGKICLLLCNEDDIYILYEVLRNEFIPCLGAYEIGQRKSYMCKHLNELLDYKPMHEYPLKDMLCIKPAHAFVSRHI